MNQSRRKERFNEDRSIWRELLGWIAYIIIILGLTYFIITFIGQRTRVSGSSMETTLSDGDNLIVDKISYRFREPKRYEIIVFPYQYEDNTFYIKRIIGLPGETVQVADGVVYIDGEILDENFGAEPMEQSGIAEEPITLGSDEYFVLGDNRNHSSDSRDPSVGILTRDHLIGRAWIRIWPMDQLGVIKHE
ncbi:MAG: signal peptidase I [Lachnospiraceae bacterium]